MECNKCRCNKQCTISLVSVCYKKKFGFTQGQQKKQWWVGGMQGECILLSARWENQHFLSCTIYAKRLQFFPHTTHVNCATTVFAVLTKEVSTAKKATYWTDTTQFTPYNTHMLPDNSKSAKRNGRKRQNTDLQHIIHCIVNTQHQRADTYHVCWPRHCHQHDRCNVVYNHFHKILHNFNQQSVSTLLTLTTVVQCSIIQSIDVKFVGRRYTTRPGAPTVVRGKHNHEVHSWVVFWMYRCQ